MKRCLDCNKDIFDLKIRKLEADLKDKERELREANKLVSLYKSSYETFLERIKALGLVDWDELPSNGASRKRDAAIVYYSNDGLSPKHISTLLGVSLSCVYKYLKSAGIDNPVAATKKEEMGGKINKLWRSGKTVTQISKDLHVSRGTVYKYLGDREQGK